MSQIRTWRGMEITIVFKAEFEKVDYGVAGSPKWKEISDLSMISVSILEVDLPISSLTPELKTTLEALHRDLD